MMRYTTALFVLIGGVLFNACSPAEGNRRGHEFMPDMVHPTGYEANLYDYYYYNRWGTEEEYKSYVMPRQSVPGTVPRGQISLANAIDENARMEVMKGFMGDVEGGIAITPNGRVPYYYTDTEEDRLKATREITRNPFPISEAGLESGKALYDIYCGICHGPNGDGQGFLVREADPAKGVIAGVYPAAPANMVQDTFINASAGRLYHAIMYGKNVMGSYADKLSYQERWEVIHYIRSLQAASKKLEYTAASNTFNNEAIPMSAIDISAKKLPTATSDTTAMGDNMHGVQKETNKH